MGETTKRTTELAAIFKVLGDPARLRIFEFLCSSSCCPMVIEDTGDVRPVVGLTVGEVCCRITGEERVTSTISQQLKQLRQAGLITMERRGKNMLCRINRDAVAALASYIDECKNGESEMGCCG